MKKTVLSILSLFLLFLPACHKSSSNPPVPPTPPVKATFTINLSYPDTADYLHKDQWELIVSEPGYVLLDTVVPVNTTITATIKAYANLVDLTTVVYHASSDSFEVTSFNGVNPSSWTTPISPINYNYHVPTDTLPAVPDTIFYVHPPALVSTANYFDDGMYMSDDVKLGGFWHPVYTPSDPLYQPGGLLVLPYQHNGNNPVFLSFGALGLYNMHTSITTHDTVDLTNMDTFATIQYSFPSPYNSLYTLLNGYIDTTDLDKSMQLWTNQPGPGILQYPRTGFQAFETFSYAVSTSTNESLTFCSFGPSLPATLTFPADPAYTISSNQADNFSVSFSSIDPTIYGTTWKAGKVSLLTVASPDSAVIHPATLLSNLDSKLLQGLNLSGLKATSFHWQTYTGLNYEAVVNYFATPAGMKKQHLAFLTSYEKTF
jgi:hypothetical protein